MSRSIVQQLVRKDLVLMKAPLLLYWLGGALSVLVVILLGQFMAGMILFVTCLAGAGMHPSMLTVLDERRERVLPFIMSLPITVREYTRAKLIVNVGAYGVVWGSLSAAALVIFLGPEGMDAGKLPFVVICLVGILLGCTIVLAVGLVTGSLGPVVGAIVGANLFTQIFLWWVVDLAGIHDFLGSDIAVWNATALTVLGGQLAAIAALIAGTYVLQARKTDFP